MLTPEDKLLIDRYLDNTLTGIELRDFLNRLDTDEHFKNEVSFHNKLVEGIIEAEDNRLMHYVMDATGYKKRLIPLSVKLIFTFLIITLGGIIFWEYIGPGSSGEKHNYFSWSFIRKKPVQENVQKTTQAETVNREYKKQSLQEEGSSAKAAIDTSTGEEIVVKKDQLLISLKADAIVLSAPNSSPTASIATPADGGSAVRDRNEYEIEFWVSPVNYKGYKLHAGKLILFGIELPDEVQLYIVNEDLWMKYGNEYYRLQSGDNFESLAEAANVPSELK